MLDSEKVFALWTFGTPAGLKVYDKVNQYCVPHPTLIGGSPEDRVGSSGVTALSNGNFVVASAGWDLPGAVPVNSAGAVSLVAQPSL